MSARIFIIFLASAAILLGCNQQGASVSSAPPASQANVDPNDAIRTVIQARIAHNGNLNLQSFNTEVKQITVDGAHARAQVEFHAKNGPGAMQLTYSLEKRDGAWFVVESNPGGGNFAHPALDGSQIPSQKQNIGGDPSVFRMLDNLHGANRGEFAESASRPSPHRCLIPKPKPASALIPGLAKSLPDMLRSDVSKTAVGIAAGPFSGNASGACRNNP